MESKNSKINTLMSALLWILVLILLVGVIYGLVNWSKDVQQDKSKYNFNFGHVGNVPDGSSSGQTIDYDDHRGIVSGLIPVEGLNLNLDKNSDVYCYVFCFDENKIYGGDGLSTVEGITYINVVFGGDTLFDRSLLAKGTKYVRLMVSYRDLREISDSEYDKVLSALTISYDN